MDFAELLALVWRCLIVTSDDLRLKWARIASANTPFSAGTAGSDVSRPPIPI